MALSLLANKCNFQAQPDKLVLLMMDCDLICQLKVEDE
jgi:hypothetical protein